MRGSNQRAAQLGGALLVLTVLAGAMVAASPDESATAQQGTSRPANLVVRTYLPRVTTDAVAPGDRNAPGSGASLATNSCPPLIEAALGQAGCMISFCESGWNPDATGALGERGWFQISPIWHEDSTWDPAGNVAAAVRISRGGTDWSAWSVRSVLETGVCPGGLAYPG